MTEEWRDIPGWEGFYQVSDSGQVRSVPRVVMRSDGRSRRVFQRILKPSINQGYLHFNLSRNNEDTRIGAHRLVLLAFVGPPPAGQEGCHNDGNPLNNTLGNLRWDTRSNNIQDSIAHGTNRRAAATSCLRGHPYTEKTTYFARSGRVCRECRREIRLEHLAQNLTVTT